MVLRGQDTDVRTMGAYLRHLMMLMLMDAKNKAVGLKFEFLARVDLVSSFSVLGFNHNSGKQSLR